jgi:hypothetical protein
MTDTKLEQAASKFLTTLDKKYNAIEQANMPNIICEEAFEAGALWERERAKVLIEACKQINKFVSMGYGEHVMDKIAKGALKQYEAADE